MTALNEIQTPELDKQAKARENGSQEIGEFLEWLRETKGYLLARYVPEDERSDGDGLYGEQPVPVMVRTEDLLAEFFGIDLNKVEAERRALLDAIRAGQ